HHREARHQFFWERAHDHSPKPAGRGEKSVRKLLSDSTNKGKVRDPAGPPPGRRNLVRLTLRTLLAYLDDTLDPSQAKLIGQKVAEGDTAQELIARIKQGTRRRRLTVPPATGPSKLDPNMVAEYLDNTLGADQTAEVEQTCLGSDVHLADVAASHQILTLVL